MTSTNKRLDEVNIHLADQSRRLDETDKRVDAVCEELAPHPDETSGFINAVHDGLIKRKVGTFKHIDAVQNDPIRRVDEINRRPDAIRNGLNHQLDAIYNDLILRIGQRGTGLAGCVRLLFVGMTMRR